MRCYFCGVEGARLNACHWTGSEYVRVDVCHTGSCRDRLARAPRRPRQRREPVVLDAGGWVVVPGLNRMLRDASRASERGE